MRLSKFRPQQSSAQLELSTTSMIDVVFLLLIFFLVTTTFLTPERQLGPNIRVQEENASSITQDIEPAFVKITRENGIAVFKMGTTITRDIEVIAELLQKYPDKSQGAFVILDDDCPFGMAAQAVAQCRRASFEPVSLQPGK